MDKSSNLTGRGSPLNPPNRFERIHIEDDFEHLEHDEEATSERGKQIPTEYFVDDSETIVSENNSPDISFRYSVNPYRGCVHGCSYCYARPSHEFLGMNAGIDFESKIVVKQRAAELLRAFLSRKKWRPEMIMFSGVTDCYQPAERKLRLTRQCLEVAAEANQPIGIITKNALITRDLDILGPMASNGLVGVAISLTTLDPKLAREMEPRTSTPAARLRAIEKLSAAGVPTKVLTAPIIPGLNEIEIPQLLAAAKQAGAMSAGFTLLRLPLTVEPVFFEWVQRVMPEKFDRIISRIRSTRTGNTSDATFGKRMRGEGPIAQQIKNMFDLFARQNGLDKKLPKLNCDLFQAPTEPSGQRRLF